MPVGLSLFRINSGDNHSAHLIVLKKEPPSATSRLHSLMLTATTCSSGGLVALDDASIKYSAVQNWPAGVAVSAGSTTITKRSQCCRPATISWTQVELVPPS